MITGDFNELDQITKTHKCPEHPDMALTVAWLTTGQFAIRCGADHFPEEVTRIPTLTEAYKQGEDIPEPLAGNIVKGQQRRARAAGAAVIPFVLGEVPKRDSETGELLTPEAIQALIDYAEKYGLDAYRGHVCLFHGDPYITVDGYFYKAKREKIPYSLTGRPLTRDELLLHHYEDDDLGYYSKVRRLDTGQEFEGYGFVKKSELTERSKKSPDRLRYPVVAGKPGNMVIKRAEWQALRRAFPIGGEE